MLALGPATPPAYLVQRPPLIRWCEHESMLGPTTPEAVRRVTLLQACFSGEARYHPLDIIVGHRPSNVNLPIWGDVGEDVIIWQQCPAYGILQITHPCSQVCEHVHCMVGRLRMDLIKITFFVAVSADNDH